jgi:hypothetical protein
VTVSSCSFLLPTKVPFAAGCKEKNTLDRKKLLCFVGGETASRKRIDEFLSQSTRKLTIFVILRSSATKNLSYKEQKGEILDFTALHSE